MTHTAHSVRNQPDFASHDQCEILRDTVLEQLALDLPGGRLHSYPKDACLWLAEDRPERVYLLRSGRVEIFTAAADGTNEVLRVVEQGELFGDLCFCWHRYAPLETTARALVRAQTVEHSYPSFVRSLQGNIESTNKLLATLCHRVAEMERRTRVLACRDARKRLAMALVDLCEFRNANMNGDCTGAVIRVSHAQLAAHTAMTRAHTTVLMTRFRRQGLVRYSRNSPITVDLIRLRNTYG